MASFAKGVAQFVTKCDRCGRRDQKKFHMNDCIISAVVFTTALSGGL